MLTANITRSKRQAIKGLSPGCFSLVMATGIVSIAADAFEHESIVRIFFTLNQASYAVLCALTLARCLAYTSHVITDLMNPAAAPGFLTTVAGTCVLGAQFVTFDKNYDMGFGLWIVGFALWAMLTYSLFTAMVVREPKANLIVINGSWLMAVVGTQSVSVLGMLLARRISPLQDAFVISSLTLYLIGCMLYILIIMLIVHRLVALPLKAEEFVPSYWINMGAAAITTLAGATLVLHSSVSPWLKDMMPFLKGTTLLSWAFGTWWIPLILILAIWRHFYKGFPIHYDASYWSLVFPLGMYSASTYQMTKAMDMPFLRPLYLSFYGVSLAAWVVVFTGFARRIGAFAKKGSQ